MEAAQRLAEEFGSVTATAVAAVREQQAPPPAEVKAHASLFQPGHMRRRLDQLIEENKRYDHPFSLVVFDVDGPGARGDDDQETVLAGRRANRRSAGCRWPSASCACSTNSRPREG